MSAQPQRALSVWLGVVPFFAFALVFLDAMKELTATLLLSPTGMTTLATEVWAHTANVEFAAAAPYAALLIVVSGLPVYLLTTRMYLNRA